MTFVGMTGMCLKPMKIINKMEEKGNKAKDKLFNTVYRSIVMRITNNETGEVEFVPLYSWTEKKK